MRSIDRRIRRLAERFSPPVNEEGMRLVALLRERRRRNRAAEGQEPENGPLREGFYDRGNRPQTLAEILQSARFRRAEAVGR
jgi:hypothetical protein